MKSESFKLSKPMLTLLEKHGITEATPIQKEIIPAITAGRDILAQSETGSGKTISFAIPIIEKITGQDGLTALVLVPTRELCMQIAGEFAKFSQTKFKRITAVYGGVSIENQISKLKSASVVIATPGRLLDLLERKVIKLDKIKFLVFDEADRMLDMGFIKDIEKILKLMPQKRQTMLFSATVSKEIAVLSQKYLTDPKRVLLKSELKPEFLRQTYYQTTPDQKLPLLIHLLKHERDLALVFCNRKHITEKIARKLSAQGVSAKCLNGDMSQSQRERVTAEFKEKRFSVLIATDVASRGLHIDNITHVYNYEIPKDVDSYTHRVGRTARAGKKGEAISLVTGGEDQKFFKQILFEYKGIISLKTVNTASLPKIEQPKFEQKKFERRFDDKKKRFEKPFNENKKRVDKPFDENKKRFEKPFDKKKIFENPIGKDRAKTDNFPNRNKKFDAQRKNKRFEPKKNELKAWRNW